MIGKNKLKIYTEKNVFRSSSPVQRQVGTPMTLNSAKGLNISLSLLPSTSNNLVSHAAKFRNKREFLKIRNSKSGSRTIKTSGELSADIKVNKRTAFINRMTSLNEEISKFSIRK